MKRRLAVQWREQSKSVARFQQFSLGRSQLPRPTQKMVPELEAVSSSPLWYFLNRHKWQLYNPSSSSSCLWLGAVCCCNIENKKKKKKKKKGKFSGFKID